MAETIWKTVLPLQDRQQIEVPANAEFLCAREQGQDQICVWYVCDPEASKVKQTIFIIGTGHPMPEVVLQYLGTASMREGMFMWHIFREYD